MHPQKGPLDEHQKTNRINPLDRGNLLTRRGNAHDSGPKDAQGADITTDTQTNPTTILRNALIDDLNRTLTLTSQLSSDRNPFFYDSLECEQTLENNGIRDGVVLSILKRIRHANDKNPSATPPTPSTSQAGSDPNASGTAD